MAELASEILIGFALNKSPKWVLVQVTEPGQPMPFFDRPVIATEFCVTVRPPGGTDTLVVYAKDALAACERRRARPIAERYARRGKLRDDDLVVLMELAMQSRRARKATVAWKRRLARREAEAAADPASGAAAL